MASESADSARAQLIKTRRGTWIDESLLLAARRECREILRAAYEAVGEDVVKVLHGEFRPALISEALNTLREELLNYRLPEEEEARSLAQKARNTAEVCGCCGRQLFARKPAYFGAEIYVGMRLLDWDYPREPQACEPRYMRTVLCQSCAPEWLSPEREDVITQLCAHCERPMISRLKLSEVHNTFCSDSCQWAYRNQLRREQRDKERKMVCEVCGEEFIATRQDAKTCSRKCKHKAYRERKREVKE